MTLSHPLGIIVLWLTWSSEKKMAWERSALWDSLGLDHQGMNWARDGRLQTDRWRDRQTGGYRQINRGIDR